MLGFCQSVQGYRFAARQSPVLLFMQQSIHLLLVLKMELKKNEKTVYREEACNLWGIEMHSTSNAELRESG